MNSTSPIISGGSGHSGTRVFNEILTLGGVFTGISRITKWPDSEDLKITNLLTRWVRPYLRGDLSPSEARRMRRAFARRLRLYFPFRGARWGFKNPRTMLLLPFLHELFPRMKFVHVIRDGRDIALGNEFAGRNPHSLVFLSEQESQLPPAERMILFWGRSNQKAMEYGRERLGANYLQMRWEDLCTNPAQKTGELLEFAALPVANKAAIAAIVMRPRSLGRWKTFPDDVRARVHALGEPWLKMFGYA